MKEDMHFIRRLGEKIGGPLKQDEFDDLLISKQNGYTVDEQGAITGLCLFNVSLDSLPNTIMPFKNLRQLVLSRVNVKAKDFSPLKQMASLTLLDLSHNEINDISFLSRLKQIVQLYLGYNRITDISPLVGLVQLSVLDLQHNRLPGIDSLDKLPSLKIVNLQDNQISDISPLRGLKGIVYLNIAGNTVADIYPLQGMSKLANLDAAGNQIDNISILSKLTGLSYLNLSGNKITDISSIQGLTGLTVLKLADNNIHSIFPLTSLRNLTNLDLDGNKIADISLPLKDLTNLTTLHLSQNSIIDLNPLKVLTNLKYLYLENNQISDLTPLRALTNLKNLRLSNNQIEDITPLTALTHLEELLLIGNRISDISPLSGLIEINCISLSSNSIISLSPLIPLTGLKKLWIANNKIDDLTPLRALTQLEILGVRINGVTDLTPLKELLNLKALNVSRNKITKLPPDIVRWWSSMEINWVDKDTNDGLNLFGNPLTDPPVEIVKKGTAAVKNYFAELARMPHLLDKLPQRWMEIRDELKARPENYITLQDYLAVCRTHQMEPDKALFLSDYLHDLGIILHFRQDPVLTDTVILKPAWATGAVYALIDSLEIQQNKGRFKRALLGRYWDAQKYPADKYSQLLRLIEKFELCFNIVGTDEYILPELLPTQRPAIDMGAYQSMGSGGNLRLHYAYEFMPTGILTRFISRLYYMIREDHYWKNGVELEFSGSSALVVSDEAQKRIRVSVSGTNNPQLMGVIRSHFDHIHDTLNMKKEHQVFEEIPCNCAECLTSNDPHFYKYHVLQKFMSKGIGIACEKSAEAVSIPQLLNGLQMPTEPGDLFETLVTIASQVQGIRETLQKDENSRNTVVALLLGIQGFRVKDQTLWGFSAAGARIGELDIKIEDERGRPVSIIEALNLDSLNTAKIDSHVRKLFINYDCSGLKENYILVYGSAKDFEGLCKKYRAHLDHIDYETYPLLGEIEEIATGYNKIAAYRARHRCNTGETVLYHLLVEL